MTIWISFRQSRSELYKQTSVHYTEPEWIRDNDFVDRGYWCSSDEREPCWYYVSHVLLGQVPQRPRELYELEVNVKECWEWS